jgi:Zn-dependent M28 family amino/carboxypeptidase
MHAAWLLARAELQRTVRFIAFDREEQGMAGSYRYAWDYRDDDIVGMICLDMIAYNAGSAGAADIWGQSASDPIKYALADAVHQYSLVNVMVQGPRDRSDHVPFEAMGFQACHLREAGANPHYHQPTDSIDTPDYLDFGYATEMTRGVVGFLADQAGVVSLPCWADLNGDRLVNQMDFLLFASAFGSDWTAPGYDPFADMNGDGVVNVTDLTWFALDYHGPCP